jgi:hypothetical protein
MSRYSDTERAEILATSRRLLEPQPEQEPEPEPEAFTMTFEHRNDRTRRELAERDERWAREREREKRQQERVAQTNGDAWATYIQETVKQAVAAEREFMRALLPELIAHLEQKIDEAVGELRAEMNVQRSADKAQVIDMPNFLRKRA